MKIFNRTISERSCSFRIEFSRNIWHSIYDGNESCYSLDLVSFPDRVVRRKFDHDGKTVTIFRSEYVIYWLDLMRVAVAWPWRLFDGGCSDAGTVTKDDVDWIRLRMFATTTEQNQCLYLRMNNRQQLIAALGECEGDRNLYTTFEMNRKSILLPLPLGFERFHLFWICWNRRHMPHPFPETSPVKFKVRQLQGWWDVHLYCIHVLGSRCWYNRYHWKLTENGNVTSHGNALKCQSLDLTYSPELVSSCSYASNFPWLRNPCGHYAVTYVTMLVISEVFEWRSSTMMSILFAEMLKRRGAMMSSGTCWLCETIIKESGTANNAYTWPKILKIRVPVVLLNARATGIKEC